MLLNVSFCLLNPCPPHRMSDRLSFVVAIPCKRIDNVIRSKPEPIRVSGCCPETAFVDVTPMNVRTVFVRWRETNAEDFTHSLTPRITISHLGTHSPLHTNFLTVAENTCASSTHASPFNASSTAFSTLSASGFLICRYDGIGLVFHVFDFGRGNQALTTISTASWNGSRFPNSAWTARLNA